MEIRLEIVCVDVRDCLGEWGRCRFGYCCFDLQVGFRVYKRSKGNVNDVWSNDVFIE